ncbi:MAG: hypothetical protein F4Y96_01345 [Chloroflexi bacterium]|nr:hypothetical protein [Chloroflexota bacterium]
MVGEKKMEWLEPLDGVAHLSLIIEQSAYSPLKLLTLRRSRIDTCHVQRIGSNCVQDVAQNLLCLQSIPVSQLGVFLRGMLKRAREHICRNLLIRPAFDSQNVAEELRGAQEFHQQGGVLRQLEVA